ncbi:hypothetical protein GCM10027180_15810 [Microbulbifer echini]
MPSLGSKRGDIDVSFIAARILPGRTGGIYVGERIIASTIYRCWGFHCEASAANPAGIEGG